MTLEFGSDGARGVLGLSFTFGEALRAVRCYVDELGAGERFLLGYDRRFLADRIAAGIARELREDGVEADLTANAVTSPLLSALVKENGYRAGITVSASHNHYSYLGVKFKGEFGGSELPATVEAVEGRIAQSELEVPVEHSYPGPSQVQRSGVELKTAAGYPNFFGLLDRPLKLDSSWWDREVVFDFMHGAAAEVAPPVVGRYLPEHQTEYLRRERDVLFGGSRPEPEGELLDPLCRKCAEKDAIGLAFDGDGDRLAAVDEEGEILLSHEVFAILLHHLVKERGLEGSVVITSTMSSRIARMAEKFDREVTRVPVGFKSVTAEMLESDVLAAGEESGGFAFGFYLPERDALLAGLFLLEAVQESGMALTRWREFLDEHYGEVHFHREDIPMNTAGDFVSAVSGDPPGNFNGSRVDEVERLDGVKLYLSDGSTVQFRASGTEPLLRVYAEGSTEGQVDQIHRSARRLLDERTD